MTILIFGASITYGAWDKKGGWAQKLREFLEEKYLRKECPFVYNLGIPGDTTEDLLKRFKSEAESRIEKEEETLFIFSIGTNDSSFVGGKNGPMTVPEKYKENIQSLVDRAKQFSEKIVFVGLAPVEESKTIPIPWNTDISYKSEFIANYNEIIKEVCAANKLLFIDVFEKLKEGDNLSEDGLHPNSEGHKKIFEIVKDSLIANKII